MNTSPSIIILSTYNGEKYLRAQLDSLVNQTYQDWVLLIRDDGSTDLTKTIIHDYCQKDARIIFQDDALGNLGVKKSFSVLMQSAMTRSEQYIFFCDQDDVWLPTKLAKQVAQLQSLEQQHGTHTPLLVHSDLRVVDQQLKLIHSSYLRFERLKRNPTNPIKTLLINNYVTGCTVGVNKALLAIAAPIPDNVFMHDWWCALCAAAVGKIGFIDEATILYRQHQHNSIGSSGLYKKCNELLTIKTFLTNRKRNLKICFDTANALSYRLNPFSPNNDIDAFAALPYSANRIQRYLSASQIKLRAANKIKGAMFWLMLAIV